MIVHGSLSLGQIVTAALFYLCIKAMSFDLSDLEKVLGESVRDALMLARITEEQAADLMGMHVSALRKCLRGEGQLQLGVARLMRLGFVFWLHFSPVLMYLVAKKHAMETAEGLGIRKGA
jgi:hypothetical protein